MSKLHAIKVPFGWVASRCRSFASWVKSQAVRTGSAARPGPENVERTPVSPSSPLAEVLAARPLLHAEIDGAARRGHVADGLVISLLANHEAELAERQRMLIEDEHRLRASLSRLDAICPAPLPPVAEPPTPPRRRKIHRLEKLLGASGTALVN